MARYVVDCSSFPSVGSTNTVACNSAAVIGESPTYMVDLTATEIGDLATAVLTYFVVCFCVRVTINFMLTYFAGRS